MFAIIKGISPSGHPAIEGVAEVLSQVRANPGEPPSHQCEVRFDGEAQSEERLVWDDEVFPLYEQALHEAKELKRYYPYNTGGRIRGTR